MNNTDITTAIQNADEYVLKSAIVSFLTTLAEAHESVTDTTVYSSADDAIAAAIGNLNDTQVQSVIETFRKANGAWYGDGKLELLQYSSGRPGLLGVVVKGNDADKAALRLSILSVKGDC